MTAVQQWRQEYGLPVRLVIMGNISPTIPLGIAQVRYIQICRRKWLTIFWKELLDSDRGRIDHHHHRHPTPFPLSTRETLSQLTTNYLLKHRSFTKLCDELQRNITAFYSHHPSKLVWDAMEVHPPFLAWFGVHGTAKKWLSLEPGTTKYCALEECQRIQSELHWWWIWQRFLLPLLIGQVREYDILFSSLADLYQSIQGFQTNDENDADDNTLPSIPPVLERYWDRVGQRKKVEGPVDPSGPASTPQGRKALGLLYELILVVGAASSSSLSSSSKGDTGEQQQQQEEEKEGIWNTLTAMEQIDGVHRMLSELFELCNTVMGELQEQWNHTNPLGSKKKSSSKNGVASSSSYQHQHHRQSLVEGLTSPAKELYDLFQDRLSISQDEWFYHYGGSPQDFIQGISTLIILGLIQTKTKRGGGIIVKSSTTSNNTKNNNSRKKMMNMVYYEKVSAMWC